MCTVFQADTVRDRQRSERELQAATGGPLHGPEEPQPDTETGQQQQSHDKAPASPPQRLQGPTSCNNHPWAPRTTASHIKEGEYRSGWTGSDCYNSGPQQASQSELQGLEPDVLTEGNLPSGAEEGVKQGGGRYLKLHFRKYNIAIVIATYLLINLKLLYSVEHLCKLSKL